MSPNGRGGLAALLLVVLLGAGVGIGIGLDRLWLAPSAAASRPSARSESEIAARMVSRFRRELALDEAQLKQVDALVRKSRADIGELRAKVEPEVQAVRARLRMQMLGVLRDDQKAKYLKMVADYEARRKKRLEGNR